MISLSHPFTTALYHFPLPLPHPFLLQQTEEGVSSSYFNVHYEGQTQCKTPTYM